MKNESTARLMKIGELAKATGTNVSTIKFYVKEGLIQAASKTSPNMAYYHTDCIARVQLIKSLQKEHYYPLSVIKRMLDTANPNQMEIALLDVIHKADHVNNSKTFSLSEAARMTRLSKIQIGMLAEKKLVTPDISGRKQRYNESDLQVMFLFRRRMDAGIPFEESAASFLIYEKALKDAAKADVDLFINQALLVCAPSTEEAVRMISVSDETLDCFVSLKRKELNRSFGSERLGDLDHFASNLSSVLQCVSDSLEELKYTGAAKQCQKALLSCPEENDPVSSALRYYHLTINSMSKSLAKSISVCGQAHAYFTALDPDKLEDFDALLLYSLKLCWLNLAPSLLNCKADAKKSMKGFSSFALKYMEEESETFTRRVISEIARISAVEIHKS